MMMKKNFNLRNVVAVAACLAATAMLASCDKDDKGKEPGSSPVSTITAAVVDGSSYNSKVDTVKAAVWFDRDGDGENDTFDVVAAAPYASGGFSIKLPDNLAAEYLAPMGGIPESMNVSNRNVKATGAELYGYKSGARVGQFWYVKLEEQKVVVDAGLTYVDNDVTITGTYAETETEEYNGVTLTYNWNVTYSVSLKKGWNFIYQTGTGVESPDGKTYTYTGSITTSEPSGMKWYYEEDDYYGAPSAAKAAAHHANVNFFKAKR